MDYHRKYLKYKKKLKAIQNNIALSEGNDSVTEHGFAVNLFENLDGASNIICTIGIKIVLLLINLAATGESKKQIEKWMGQNEGLNQIEMYYKDFNRKVFRFSIFFNYDKLELRKSYIDMIDEYANIINHRFDDAESIVDKTNNFFKKETTKGLLTDVIHEKDIVRPAIIASACFFNASWKYPFDPKETERRPFHDSESNIVEIMHQINEFDYYENRNIQLLELPYCESGYTMGIILPKKYLEEDNLNYSVYNVPQFTPSEINEFINNLEHKIVEVYLPKFTAIKKYDLVPILRKMDVTGIFEKNNDLGYIGNHVFFSKFIHQTVLQVDEFGFQANKLSNNKFTKEKVFKANHIFSYYIRDSIDNIILLMGDYQGE